MQLEIKKYLFDIKISIDSIFGYLGYRRDFKIYESNKLLKRGVESELEIIGEAISKILNINPTVPVTNARKIVDLRN